MLTIRKEQMEVFSQALMVNFAKKMVNHLLADFSSEVKILGLDHKGIESLVDQGITDARGRGIEYEEDIQLYLDCLVLLGPEFATDPKYPVGEILKNAGKTIHTKMAEINEYLLFGLGGQK